MSSATRHTADHQTLRCPLCSHPAEPFRKARKRDYWHCSGCGSVMMDPRDYVTPWEEKSRYETHNNDVEDPRYQNFVAPLVRQIISGHSPAGAGLDFGSGTGPVITKLLRDQGYQVQTFDPFFDNNTSLLREKYDYIACCEVAEHFHKPRQEFEMLRGLLKPGGKLYLMTRLYEPHIDFASWNYKNDETHVFFYSRRAMEWIADNMGFSGVAFLNDQMITFTA